MAETRRIGITSRRLNRLLRQLHRRGVNRKESGAFLLAPPTGSVDISITRVVYYDDLDAECLTGGISMSSSGFKRLNDYCARHAVRVVADVHTHPGSFVMQSRIDSANPMVALPGHIALIVPNFAFGRPPLGKWGAHIYHGAGSWTSVYGSNVDEILRVAPSSIERLVSWFGRASRDRVDK